ncbi:MAG TPA: HlyD family secretion protein [Thermoanaerobaculia bacterium]|nr:HlyD family secretion protein [Thermoanaerobaculia bacterium]
MREDSASSSSPAVSEIAEHEPMIRESRARKLYLMLGGAVALLLILYGIYWLMTSGKETTDDSQIAADIVPVAARVAGQVTIIYVKENQVVKRGQLIAELDPGDAQAKVAQAEGDFQTAVAQAADADARKTVSGATARGAFTAAQAAVQSSRESVDTSGSQIAAAKAAVARASANAEKARLDFSRASELGAKGDIARAQVDAARAANESAQADLAQATARLQEAENNRQMAEANVGQARGKLEQSSPVQAQVNAAAAQAQLGHAKVLSARAALQTAQLTLSYTKIFAPADGIASKLAVHPGGWATVGQPIVQLVPRSTYIVANFKETQMEGIRPGARAEVKVDALGRKTFEGHVESLSGGTGASFSMLPPDNASGNFVKVVQRVPVRISWNGPASDEIPVGSSAEVTVFTK